MKSAHTAEPWVFENETDIIGMARDAGLSITPPRSGQYDGGRLGGDVIGLRRFANLVAESVREECAKLCKSEADRALFNFKNDIPKNQLFWNGAEQMATGCMSAIRAVGDA